MNILENIDKWMVRLNCYDEYIYHNTSNVLNENITEDIANISDDKSLDDIVNELNGKLKVGKCDIVSDKSAQVNEDITDFMHNKGDNQQINTNDISHNMTAPKWKIGSEGHKSGVSYCNDKMLEYMLYLSPSDDACPGAGNCAKGCLIKTGNLAFKNGQQARQRKTNSLQYTPDSFFSDLCADLELLKAYASFLQKRRDIKGFFARINGTSDFSMEDVMYFNKIGRNILELFPDIQFIDYTKVFIGGRGTQAAIKGEIANDVKTKNRVKNLGLISRGNYDTYKSGNYPNYYAVYSYDGDSHTSNKMDCEQILEDGGCVAMIFDDYNNRLPIPKTFPFGGHTYRVVIGDFSDARHLDREKYNIGEDEGFIVALSFKSPVGTKNGSNIDKDGNNINTQSVDLASYYGIDPHELWGVKYNPSWCEKHLWPELKEKGFDFYGYRLSDKKKKPHYEYDKDSDDWKFHDVPDTYYTQSGKDTTNFFKRK